MLLVIERRIADDLLPQQQPAVRLAAGFPVKPSKTGLLRRMA
ncbi:hypothetical protein ACX3YG_13960 [Pseudomonas wadenswilerensis]